MMRNVQYPSLRWKFIKENKKVRKQELDQESIKKTRKKTKTRPTKRTRKQELDQESDLITFLVEFLFSFFFFVFLFSYSLVFFYKFPPLKKQGRILFVHHVSLNLICHTFSVSWALDIAHVLLFVCHDFL